MALTAENKQKTISEYQQAKGDTGSVDVQVALLTEDIKKLTEHFKTAKHDYHSRQGLMQKVSKRRKLLKYLKNIDINRYRELLKRLDLREIAE